MLRQLGMHRQLCQENREFKRGLMALVAQQRNLKAFSVLREYSQYHKSSRSRDSLVSQQISQCLKTRHFGTLKLRFRMAKSVQYLRSLFQWH